MQDGRDALYGSAWVIVAGLISGLLEFWIDRPFRYPDLAERALESALMTAVACAAWYGIASRRRRAIGVGLSCLLGLVMAMAMATGASLARQSLVLIPPSVLFPVAGSLAMASLRSHRDLPTNDDPSWDSARREPDTQL
jgi:hypothetical protein